MLGVLFPSLSAVQAAPQRASMTSYLNQPVFRIPIKVDAKKMDDISRNYASSSPWTAVGSGD